MSSLWTPSRRRWPPSFPASDPGRRTGSWSRAWSVWWSLSARLERHAGNHPYWSAGPGTPWPGTKEDQKGEDSFKTSGSQTTSPSCVSVIKNKVKVRSIREKKKRALQSKANKAYTGQFLNPGLTLNVLIIQKLKSLVNMPPFPQKRSVPPSVKRA